MLDLTCKPIQKQDELVSQGYLEAAYGTEYSQQRVDMLFDFAREEGWSGQRLIETVKHVIRSSKWKDWTVADFLSTPTGELKNYNWVLEELAKDRTAQSRMVGYRVGGVTLWKYADGKELPFPKVYPVQKTVEPPIAPAKSVPKEVKDFLAKGFSEEKRQEKFVMLEDLMKNVKPND